MSQFARNIGSELVANAASSLYSEDDGSTSGFLGYTKPITTMVYGNYELVEGLASRGWSPFDLEIDLSLGLTAPQLEAYTRAVLIFSKGYFSERYPHHSYAFVRALHQVENATASIRRLGDLGEDYWRSDDYRRLKVAIKFIRNLTELLASHPTPPRQREREYPLDGLGGVHARVAKLIFEIITAASYVTKPASTCWNVQHNAVWADLFDFDRTASSKLIQFHLRRLLYNEIRKMESSPNFVTAHIIGYCLNVLGIAGEWTRRDKKDEYRAVRRAAIHWAKYGYLKLVREYPAVAEGCLMGGLSFDPGGKRLVRTFTSMLGQEPRRKYLELVDSDAT